MNGSRYPGWFAQRRTPEDIEHHEWCKQHDVCPTCCGDGGSEFDWEAPACNVCGGSGKWLSYRVYWPTPEVRCVHCEAFRGQRVVDGVGRWCADDGNPVAAWAPHRCPRYRLHPALAVLGAQ